MNRRENKKEGKMEEIFEKFKQLEGRSYSGVNLRRIAKNEYGIWVLLKGDCFKIFIRIPFSSEILEILEIFKRKRSFPSLINSLNHLKKVEIFLD